MWIYFETRPIMADSDRVLEVILMLRWPPTLLAGPPLFLTKNFEGRVKERKKKEHSYAMRYNKRKGNENNYL